MNKVLNLGNKEYALKLLGKIKNNNYVPFDLRVTNAHLPALNKIIGRNIFRKDVLYVNTQTLWEIMQPIGGRGKHHYHQLSPQEILDALKDIKNSKDVNESYDGRYLIITLVMHQNDAPIAIILEPHGQLKENVGVDVARVITMYPYNKK